MLKFSGTPYTLIANDNLVQMDRIMAFIKELCETTDAYPNVRLYDFDDCKFTNNRKNYHDERHYHPDINRYMPYAIKHDLHRFRKENFPQYEKEMLR
jgi:hypothetical protein